MSAKVINLFGPWKRAHDASAAITEALMEIPDGINDYQICEQSRTDLRQAADLLEHARPLLRRAADREERSYLQHMRTIDAAQ